MYENNDCCGFLYILGLFWAGILVIVICFAQNKKESNIKSNYSQNVEMKLTVVDSMDKY